MRSARPIFRGSFVARLVIAESFFLFAMAGPVLSENKAAQDRVTTSSAGARSRLTSKVSGSIPARDGQSLHLATNLGNIVIHSQDAEEVNYQVDLETSATQKDPRELLKDFSVLARKTPEGVSLKGQAGRESAGRLWVTFRIDVPRNYSLDISTGGGSIETGNINGRVGLSTLGGSITTGNIAGSARLETDGGHITAKDVSGNLVANTGGGHITAGSIGGNATLNTSGGHIRVASVGGIAHLTTGGGNVSLGHSGPELIAETAGGQIEVGEAAGLVRAKTGGGGIHVVRASGPADLQTVGGSIYLTQVDSAVTASTAAGGITAWFAADPPKHSGNCDLQSNDGDIVVYLPQDLPVTIDAQIRMADEHRVILDPAFPLHVSYADSASGSRTVRAVGSLNGGGELLRLRAIAGNIHLVLGNAGEQRRIYNMQMQDLERQIRSQLHRLEQLQQADGGLFLP